ncbi:MAG: hypothetical protein HY077_18925 [Elusimicrobia bacterium]|nr:hypothetical protein [Elusimicrobiota bacterium]
MDKIMEQIVTALKPFFDRIDERFTRIDARFEQVDGRFDDIEKDLANTKTVLGDVAGNVRVLMREMVEVQSVQTATRKSVDEINAKIDDFTGRSALHAETLLEHDKRLRRLEEHRA